MKTNIKILILILFLLSGVAYAKKLGDLKDILNPFNLKVSEDIIYISDQYSIFYYSNDQLELLKKVGGKGEGPGEFRIEPSVKILKNSILTYIPFRIIYFSKNGELLRQSNYNGVLWDIDSVKGNYVVSRTKFEKNVQVIDFTVMDSNFKEIKILSSLIMPSTSRIKKTEVPLVQPLNKFQCYNDEIYVAKRNQKGFCLFVFDYIGNPIRTIKRDNEKIKITSADRKKILDNFKNIPAVKRRWHSLTRIFDYTIPEYYPDIQDFRISNERIYVKTYRARQNEVEFIILSLDGKLLGKTFLPDIKERHFDINNNKFYYLIENDENENWELHVVNIHIEIDSKKNKG